MPVRSRSPAPSFTLKATQLLAYTTTAPLFGYIWKSDNKCEFNTFNARNTKEERTASRRSHEKIHEASLLFLVPGRTGGVCAHNFLSGFSLDASDDDRLRLVWVRGC